MIYNDTFIYDMINLTGVFGFVMMWGWLWTVCYHWCFT